MSFSAITQYKAAFKLLFGKAHTSNSKDLVNEAKAANVLLGASQIMGQTIDPTPATAVAAGVAQHVICNLVLDSTTNGLSYQAVYPTGHPLVGQNVSNIIPSAFGSGYTASLYNNGTLVPPLDATNWFLTCSAGVVTSETALSLVSGTLDCYVYIGQMVQTRLDATTGSDTENYTADVAIADRQVVYIQGSDVMSLGDSTVTAMGKLVGIAATTTASGSVGPVFVRDGALITFPAATFAGLTDYDIFVGSAGAWTANLTAFSNGQEIVKIGKVKSATELVLSPEVILYL